METLDFLKNQSIDDLKNAYSISCKEYDDRIVFNYDQIDSYKHRFTNIVRECRNLILNKDCTKVLHRSFDRFYNYNEDPNTKKFNIASARIDQKLDGSLIGLYYDGKSWCCCTRSMAFAEGDISIYPLSYASKYGFAPKTFSDLVNLAFDFNDFKNKANKNFSYICEITSPFNRVITPYEDIRLTLLAVRNKITGEYLNRVEEVKIFNDIHLPEVYRFNNIDDLFESIKQLPSLDEGYVCNMNNWFIKIKNPAYLAVLSLRSNNAVPSEDKIIEIVYNYNENEYLSYYPEDKEFFEPYLYIRNMLLTYFDEEYNKIKHIERQKEFAYAVKHLKCNTVFYKMREKNWSVNETLKYFGERNIKTIIRIYKSFL